MAHRFDPVNWERLVRATGRVDTLPPQAQAQLSDHHPFFR